MEAGDWGPWHLVAPVSVHGSHSWCQSAHSRQGGNMTAGQGYSGDEDKRIDRTIEHSAVEGRE